LFALLVAMAPGLVSPAAFSHSHKQPFNGALTADVKSRQESSAASQITSPVFISRWPAVGATHRTSKFSGAVGSYGLCRKYKDNITGQTNPGFEFPINSGIEYLWEAALWIGGMVGDDTLVSTAYTLDTRDGYMVLWGRELYPPDDPIVGRGISPVYVGEETTYRTHFVDTFTSGVPDLVDDFFDRPHIPLNLSVIQKSYSLDANPYRNIMLLDFIITNIGPDKIRKAYVGILIDGDVCSDKADSYECYSDDLTGSLRDISTGYIIDNDGDPQGGFFQDSLSPIDGLALRPVMIYPPVRDTNFNWWFYGDEFGPRLKGTPADPFRDFQTGGIGVPSGDINKYYIMSHNEWDYDQVMTATIDSTDSLWLYPDRSLALDISGGYDTRFLLSVGPIDLMPDSSMRAVFALFGGDFVHVDPTNGKNLSAHDYRGFYYNLHFDILRNTAEEAVSFAQSVLDPMRPPTGLSLVRVSADTAVLSWDRWALPNVTGYNVYLKPVDDSFFIGPYVMMPPVAPIGMGNWSHHFPAGQTTGEITDLLRPGQLYFAAIAHVTEVGEGMLSLPIVVGYEQLERVQRTHEFAFFRDGDSSLTLTWKPSEDPSIRYYKIYRTLDTTVANSRYRPFITDDSSLVPFAPRTSRKHNGVTYWYYEIEPYDSTASNRAIYTDQHPVDGAIYWISAVGRLGYPGPYSKLIVAQKGPNPTKDIIVVLGANLTPHDYIYVDSMIDFYNRTLTGYEFDIYNWRDSNLLSSNCGTGYCTDWRDLARYKVVIVEEFPSPRILTPKTEPVHKLLTRILDSGHDLAYFGTPPGHEEIHLMSYDDTVLYDPGSFESYYFGLESTYLKTWKNNYNVYNAVDSLAGFNRAIPVDEGLPYLPLDSNTSHRLRTFFRQLFVTDSVLPLTGAFRPNQRAEVLYRYGSLYPNTSELDGKPCGLMNQHSIGKAYAFSFHLWAIDETAARELIDYIMEHRSEDQPNDNPPLLPTSLYLYQNYPNPFNSGTRISFDLSNPAQVTLEIYNILGQQVNTLLNQSRPAGSYTIDWDGRDSQGRFVASGIYFYRLKADNKTDAKKMIFLK